MEVALKVTRDKKFPLVEYMQFDSKKEGASEETPGREPQVGSSLSQNQELLQVSGGVVMKTFAPEKRLEVPETKKSVQGNETAS